MKKTAKEGVKRGKNRPPHKRVAPAGAMTNEKNTPKVLRATANRLDKDQDVTAKKIANGRLPPLVPPVKLLPQKNNDIELNEHQNAKKNHKLVDIPEVESGKLPVLDETPSRASSPATRRRAANMTNYERMLQREKNRGRKISSGTNYNILQSETEEDGQSVEGSTLVVEDETNRSTASLRSRSSAKHDPNYALLQYFAKHSSSADVDDSLDLEHVESLLREGASVNTCDRFGQTLLHEVSKTWGTDVAQFFIDQGKYI